MTNLPPEDLFFLWLKALITNSEWKFLLLQANTDRFNNHDGSEYRDIPGWRINRDEDIYTALRREIEEETGIHDIEISKHLWIQLSPTRIPRKDHDFGLMLSVYIVTIPPQTKIILSDEHISYKRCEYGEMIGKLKHKFDIQTLYH